MSKWHSFLEYLQFSLKVLFFATLLLGIGSTISNPLLKLVDPAEPSTLLLISNLMRYGGAFTIQLFPLLVFIKVLGKHFSDSSPLMIGIFSYIIILIIVMVLERNDFPSYFYHSVLGIELKNAIVNSSSYNIQYPYQMGIFPLIIAYLITCYSYKRSRHHIRHGMFYFIDHDCWALIIALFFSVIAGIAFTFIWPWVIQLMMLLFDYIASDINNPIHLFFYGILDRLFAISNMVDIPRNVFWLSEAGGSYIDVIGNSYYGDASIWMATKDMIEVNVTSGSFISGFYVINLFLIPSFLFAYYRLMGTKEQKYRYLIFILLAWLLSIFCGNPIPIEIGMLVLSPLLYLFYLLIVGFAFAACAAFEAFVGFYFDGNLLTSLPGNLLDLFSYIGNYHFYRSIWIILIIGVILGIIFYFATIFYFRHFAIGLLSMQDADEICEHVIHAMGGIDNITAIYSTPDKIMASFKNRDEVNLDELHELGAYLILESRDGYTIRLGNLSIMIGERIQKKLK